MSIDVLRLSDERLLCEVADAVVQERCAGVRLIALLAELDARRLYLGAGCSSLFTYCTRVLRLSEHAAYSRIEAARAARQYPIVLEMLEAGTLNLTSIGLLRQHLTPENHREVLASAAHRSKREVEELVARFRPQPDVTPTIRRLPQPRQAPAVASPLNGSSAEPLSTTDAVRQPAKTEDRTTPAKPPSVKAVAPERYRIQITVTRETHDRLRRVQDLMRHTLPSGDPAEIFDRALSLLLDQLERTKVGSTTHPRPAAGHTSASRHIPAAVRRAVWARDAGRCAFVGTHGRCTETGFLEFHHVRPYATDGTATIDNIELRCRAHNAYEAELFFGVDRTREERAGYLNSVRTEWFPLTSRICHNRGTPGWRNWQTLGT